MSDESIGIVTALIQGAVRLAAGGSGEAREGWGAGHPGWRWISAGSEQQACDPAAIGQVFAGLSVIVQRNDRGRELYRKMSE